MPKKIIVSSKHIAPAIGPYSPAVRCGDLLFCSGQIAIDPESGQLVAGDIKVQTRQVLENISGLIEGQGLTLDSVVKATVFMTDLAEFGAMNEVYASYFKADFPARSTVQVATLPKAAAVEIEVIASY